MCGLELSTRIDNQKYRLENVAQFYNSTYAILFLPSLRFSEYLLRNKSH